MELPFKYQSRDFPTVYRILRPVATRALGISLVYLSFSMIPSLLILAWQGTLFVATPFVIAGFSAALWGHGSSKRFLRNQFQSLCVSRTLRIGTDGFESEWRHGWNRCAWSTVSHVEEHQGWLVVRRKASKNPQALIPPAAVQYARDIYGVDLRGHLSARIAEASQEVGLPLREEGTAVCEVAFQMDSAEMAQVAERSFQARDAADHSPWAFTLTLVAAIIIGLLLPGNTGWRQVLIPGLAVPLALAGFAPWRRRAFGRLLGDPSLLREQSVIIRDSGIEQRQRSEQALARWPQIATIVDAKRFVVVHTRHGGIACVPRRVFADGKDDRFLKLVQEQLEYGRAREAAELEEAGADVKVGAQTPLIETGNPYQPPPT